MGLISRVSSRTYRGATQTTMTKKLGFFEDFMLAGVAAGVSKTCAAPIERVKLLVQNQDEMIKQGRLDKPYTGVIDCTTRTLKTEGIIPFWRGNLANVPKTAPGWQKFSANIMSGGIAGSLSLSVVYSLDFARTRLANDAKGKGGERQFNGLLDVYKKTLATDGIGGLYRGFVISCVGIFIYRGLYFGIYDTVKPIMIGDGGSFLASFALGWGVTVVSGLASYPIDTIRR